MAGRVGDCIKRVLVAYFFLLIHYHLSFFEGFAGASFHDRAGDSGKLALLVCGTC
jgi:hypothetical protein